MTLGVGAAHAAVCGAIVAAVVSIRAVSTVAVWHVYRRRRPVTGFRVHHSGRYILGCVVHGCSGRRRGMVAIIAQTLVRMRMRMMRGRRCGIVCGVARVLVMVARERAVAVMVRVRERVMVVVMRCGGHIIIDHFRRMRSVRVPRHTRAAATKPNAPTTDATTTTTADPNTDANATHVTRRGGHGVVAIVVMIVIGNRRELRFQSIAHGHGALDMMWRMWIAH